ncbi:MAG TPA: DUF6022 family protein [Anaerolineae bacterium]|nr:DUF6022 family protein [Anaerolineae bacterium]
MTVSQIVALDNKERDIHAIGRYIQAHIAENWQVVLETRHDKLLDAYNRAGDMAYGTYLDLLFRPVHKQLKQAGLRPKPRLPGDFDISREWGRLDETDQQRWMWSTIHSIEGEALGTIVTIVFHDHTQFRIPRQPQIIALAETSQQAVVEALSRRSADFKNAREAKIEIAEYLRSLESPG